MHSIRWAWYVALKIVLITFTSACDSAVEDGVKVVGLSEPIIALDKPELGSPWEASIERDLVIISIDIPKDAYPVNMFDTHTERGASLVLTLRETGSPFPSFVSCVTTLEDGRKASMESGHIRIQQWDINGILSGMIDGKSIFIGDRLINFNEMFWAYIGDTRSHAITTHP